jgi:hypothetical protein
VVSDRTVTDSAGLGDKVSAPDTTMNIDKLKKAAFSHICAHIRGRGGKLEIKSKSVEMRQLERIKKRTGDKFSKWEKESKDMWTSLQAVHEEVTIRAVSSIEEHVPEKILQEPEKHEIEHFLPVISQFV